MTQYYMKNKSYNNNNSSRRMYTNPRNNKAQQEINNQSEYWLHGKHSVMSVLSNTSRVVHQIVAKQNIDSELKMQIEDISRCCI